MIHIQFTIGDICRTHDVLDAFNFCKELAKKYSDLIDASQNDNWPELRLKEDGEAHNARDWMSVTMDQLIHAVKDEEEIAEEKRLHTLENYLNQW